LRDNPEVIGTLFPEQPKPRCFRIGYSALLHLPDRWISSPQTRGLQPNPLALLQLILLSTPTSSTQAGNKAWRCYLPLGRRSGQSHSACREHACAHSSPPMPFGHEPRDGGACWPRWYSLRRRVRGPSSRILGHVVQLGRADLLSPSMQAVPVAGLVLAEEPVG
jgi:hypothetical protein